MDHTHYLATFTGYTNPGRHCLRAKPAHDRRIRHKQAETLFRYMDAIFRQNCATIAATCKDVMDQDDLWFSDKRSAFLDVFNKIKDCCYPYISVLSNDVREAIDLREAQSHPFGIVLPITDHMLTIANPKYMKRYLLTQIGRLLSEKYTVEVGLSIVPIPVLFALESQGVRTAPTPGRQSEAIETYFPMPNLAEIDDSFTDATYKRRNASSFVNYEYRLFYSAFWQEYITYLSDYTRPSYWKQTDRRYLGEELTKIIRESKKLRADSGEALLEYQRLPPRIEEPSQPLSSLRSRFPKRLGYFDALRADFSFSRLRHYTHTSPEYFQDFILLTNYAKYVRKFILRAISEIISSKPDKPSLLIVSGRPTSDEADGRIFDRAAILKLFSSDELLYISGTTSGRGVSDQNTERLSKNVELIINQEFMVSDAQMPAYHYISGTSDGAKPRPNVTVLEYRESIFEHGPLPGVSLINIGVGPSNARTMTDHVAVLRPLCWIMVGHCGGLRTRQRLGDYVVAAGYIRRDGVLDEEVPLDAPVNATRVINWALNEAATYEITKSGVAADQDVGDDVGAIVEQWWPAHSRDAESTSSEEREQIKSLQRLRSITRTGPVLSIANRNWEQSPTEDVFEMFEKYRAVAVDMESATVAANAFRYRIPHATFLCISDKPLHGAIKMRLFADDFYQNRTHLHLNVALSALKMLSIDFDSAADLLHARELRGLDDPPWR